MLGLGPVLPLCLRICFNPHDRMKSVITIPIFTLQMETLIIRGKAACSRAQAPQQDAEGGGRGKKQFCSAPWLF